MHHLIIFYDHLGTYPTFKQTQMCGLASFLQPFAQKERFFQTANKGEKGHTPSNLKVRTASNVSPKALHTKVLNWGSVSLELSPKSLQARKFSDCNASQFSLNSQLFANSRFYLGGKYHIVFPCLFAIFSAFGTAQTPA